MPNQPDCIAVQFPLAGEWCAVNTCFKEYESYANGQWRQVINGIPGRRERIRRRAEICAK